jgi:hypothetical protein
MTCAPRFRSALTRCFCVGVLFFAAGRDVHGADTGQFQLIIAAPDPVVAGERVQFQVIAVNQGTEIWDPRRLYLQAEVYDADKKYRGRADRFRPATAVNPGESLLANLVFEVPVDYAGKYFYRIFLVHNDQRIIESDFRSFQVRERPLVPAKPPPVALGGNIVASYKNETGPNDYVGNLSVNLVGRMKERSFLFNTYTFHDRTDSLDVYTVLLNYYGPWMTTGVGDISPTFSPLSLYGQGMRGGMTEGRFGAGGSVGWGFKLVGARTVESQEGTATTDGVFRRMLYGGQGELYLPGRVTLRGNYVSGSDVEDSVEVTGPTQTPADDRVSGGGATWELWPGVKLEGDYQTSAFKADEKSTAPAVMDSAWRGGLGLEFSKLIFSGYVQRTGTDFVSFGAPNATRDRFTYDGTLSVYPVSWVSLYGSFNRYRDNLEDDPSQVTTTQQIVNGGLTFTLPTQTSLNTGYSVNTAVGDPRTAQDNETVTFSYGATQGWRGQSLSATFQTSEFTDKTRTSNDLLTNTIGGALNLSRGTRLSASLGATVSSTEDQVDRSVQETRSYSVSMSAELVRNLLYSQIWGTLTATNDNDVVNRADREDTSANIELTYQLKATLALTLGAYRNATEDAVTSANDVTANGGNVRISYSF